MIHSTDKAAIIGRVELYGVVRIDSVWGWRVRNAKLYKRPIPAKGKFGLWKWRSA